MIRKEIIMLKNKKNFLIIQNKLTKSMNHSNMMTV